MWPAFLRPAADSIVAQLQRSGGSPRLQALHILWSVWAFMTPLFTPVGAGFWWSLVLTYPVFVLLFALLNVRPQAEAGFLTSALVILACVSMPWNPCAWTYGVFACVYVPYAGSLRISAMKIILYESVMLAVAWSQNWPFGIMALVVGVCTSSGFGSLMGRVSMARHKEQRLSHDEVRRLAALAERERIGRDLHDLLGHTLSLITLKLELSRKLFDRDSEAARREMEEAEKVARHALAEVRSAVTGIRATDLAAELASARLLLESSAVQLDGAPPPDLPANVERDLALVLREAVTNIARHARATHASIDWTCSGDSVQLRIRDNGRGGLEVDGNGLRGMRERVRALGGSLHVDSPLRHGTVLDIRVPLAAAAPSVQPQEGALEQNGHALPDLAGGKA